MMRGIANGYDLLAIRAEERMRASGTPNPNQGHGINTPPRCSMVSPDLSMKAAKGDILVQRLDEFRYAVAVDGVVRYVGNQAECERRVAILLPKSDRTPKDQALARFGT